jgi:hypothetical protein
VRVDYLAYTMAGAFGDFGRASRCVLAGGSATLPNILTGRSNTLGSPFANAFGALADFTCRAALMGLLIGRSLRCAWRLWRGLALAVLADGALAADGKSEREEQEERLWECGLQGSILHSLNFGA